MAAPVPMLSVSGRRWPDGGEWVSQPKWDGFRLNARILRLMQRDALAGYAAEPLADYAGV